MTILEEWVIQAEKRILTLKRLNPGKVSEIIQDEYNKFKKKEKIMAVAKYSEEDCFRVKKN